jgi:hypothetical protein
MLAHDLEGQPGPSSKRVQRGIDVAMMGTPAESARGIAPRAAHRTGRESLDSSGSCHPTKAAAFRQEKEFLRLPVDSIPTWVTRFLRSTGVTPLPR